MASLPEPMKEKMMRSLLAGAALAALLAGPVLAQDAPPPPPPPGGPGMMHMRHRPMTAEQMQARVALEFAKMDTNHDGVVTHDEFDAFVKAKQAEMQAKRAEHRDRAFARMDTNHDGMLSRQEFDAPMGPPPGGPGGPGGHGRHGMMRGHMAAMWFDRADANHDGKVTLAEAQDAAAKMFARMQEWRERRGGMGGGDMPPPPPPPQ